MSSRDAGGLRDTARGRSLTGRTLVCLRCFNGIPEEWVRRWSGTPRSDGAIGQAFCWVCYAQVRVGEADAA